jgi:para-aminobenzoate synthetase component 2
MILVIDNYDSFVFNLVRYVAELGYDYLVKRNDQITIADIVRLAPSHIILSPGPCTPNEAGICLDIVKNFYNKIPILGVCLGHQVIGQAFGGKIVRAKEPMHGKARLLTHDHYGIFKNIKNPLMVGRYHSLVVDSNNLASQLHVNAVCEAQDIMAFTHKDFPVYGVQFHIESIMTECGHQMLQNFLYH